MKRENEKPTRLGPGGLRENKRRGNLSSNSSATPIICQSAAAQRQRIYAWLRYASLTTFEGREKLNIPHVAGRIEELRKQGLEIRTEWTLEFSAGGSRHRIARYVLEEANR